MEPNEQNKQMSKIEYEAWKQGTETGAREEGEGGLRRKEGEGAS